MHGTKNTIYLGFAETLERSELACDFLVALFDLVEVCVQHSVTGLHICPTLRKLRL